jgi:hypothetical protein
MRKLISLLLLMWGADFAFANPDGESVPTIAPTISRGYFLSQPQSSRLLPPSSEETSDRFVLDLFKDFKNGLKFRPDLGALNDFFVTSLSFDTSHLFNSLLSPWQLFGVELESRFSPFFSIRVAAKPNLFAIGGDVRFHGFEMRCTFQHDGYGTGGNPRVALDGVIGL